jgi:NCAIR mutase (PurE)-related protein
VNRARLTAILDDVRAARLDVAAAAELLIRLPYEDLGFARLDHHRGLRQLLPEVVLCTGKSEAEVAAIVARLAHDGGPVLATRATEAIHAAVRSAVPAAHWVPEARAVVVGAADPPRLRPGVLVVTAGTADLPVAHEAALTVQLGGSSVELICDVGVAGVHRLLDQRDALMRARVIVVVAGMDGALASVVGGLVGVPVIAVPTSVGYGASFGGLSALLTMLTSCAPGIAVVNIDNGFGAGYLAAMINRREELQGMSTDLVGEAVARSESPAR